MFNIAVFASGSGTNFQALIDNVKKGNIKGRLKLLITENPEAGAIKRAENANIPVEVIHRNEFDEYSEYAISLANILLEESIDLIVLAGYMKKIPSHLIDEFKGKIINIHPALIPSFCGKGFYGDLVHEAVLKYGVKLSGVTVHFVDEQYDHGPIISQETVNVDFDETIDSLKAKIQKVEHKILPEIVALFAERKISVIGRKVKIET